MKQYFKIIIFSIIFGGLSGIVLDRAVLPYLSSFENLKKYGFLKGAVENTTIINKTEQVVVKDEQNVFEVLNKANPAVVSIEGRNGQTLGSGVVLTSDGIIMTRSGLVGVREEIGGFKVVFGDSSKADPISARNSGSFTILKIDKTNLSVVNVAVNARVGERVIALGRGASEEKELVSSGIINYFNSRDNIIYTDAKNYPAMIGAGIFNSKGEIAAINISDIDEENIRGVILPKIDELIAEMK